MIFPNFQFSKTNLHFLYFIAFCCVYHCFFNFYILILCFWNWKFGKI